MIFKVISISLIGAFFLVSQEVYANNVEKQQSENIARLSTLRLPNQPADFTEIKVGENIVKSGQNFIAESEWLRSLKVKVQNTSSKTIKFVLARIEFPRSASEAPLLANLYIFRGKNLLLSPSTSQPFDDLSLSPQSEVELVYAEKTIASFYNTIKEKNYPNALINNISLSIEAIVFDNDLSWYRGFYGKRDSKDPSKWVTIPPDEAKISIASLRLSAKKNNELTTTAKNLYIGCYWLAGYYFVECWYGCSALTEDIQDGASHGYFKRYIIRSCREYGVGEICTFDQVFVDELDLSSSCVFVKSQIKPSNSYGTARAFLSR